MTLIDLAALLAKYSFFPNLSLSWLLWLLISQLQKPPWMQRDFNAHRLPLSFSLTPFMFFLSLVLSLSRACYLATSLSLSHTFSLIWQQSEPCRWKSFQHISRKLIYFHNKWDPLSWIHLYTSRCTKQEVVSGPRLPLLHSPRLSLPVYPTVWSHTHTHSLLIQTRSIFFFYCVTKFTSSDL